LAVNSDSSAPLALDDLTVLDLSHGIAGPFGARLLGDLGADVVKVEKPDHGDFARRLKPLVASAPEDEQSLLFQYLNWNKRGITLDLRAAEAQPVLERLVRGADVVVESFSPGTLDGWGIGHGKMFEWKPGLVICSVTNFGQTGPYASYKASDLVFQAMSGIMHISGTVEGEPLKHGLRQSVFCAGLNVPYATLAALRAAEVNGEGQLVDLSIHECLVSELVMNIPAYAMAGFVQGRRQAEHFPMSGDPIATRDGFVTLQAVAGRSPYGLYADIFDCPELRDPALEKPATRAEMADWLRFVFEEALSKWDARELFQKVSEGRQLAGFVQTAVELLDCPQLQARQFFVEPDHPATGTFRFPGAFAHLSATPFSVRRRSPLLGEHTEAVLDECGVGTHERSRLRAAGVI
jgi:crotonobetainyl-CoA:carnitine CoA-transferase CaiB-like acyl-CoA transferase